MQTNSCSALLPDGEFLVTSVVYSGVSLISLLVISPSIAYSMLACCRRSNTAAADSSDGLFLIISLVVGMYMATNSFQWVLLLERQSPFAVGCLVISAFYMYSISAVVTAMLCVGFHLLLLAKPPKCLRVIMELRVQRFRRVELCYFLLVALLPLVYVPLKFLLDAKGGNGSGRGCWINVQCNIEFSWRLEPIVLLSAAMLTWIFTIVVIAIVLVVLCRYSKKLGNANIYALLCLSMCYLVGFVIGGATSIKDGSEKPMERYAVQLIKAVGIPLPNFIAGIVLMTRTCHIRIATRRRLTSTSNIITAPCDVSPLVSSATHYRPELEE